MPPFQQLQREVRLSLKLKFHTSSHEAQTVPESNTTIYGYIGIVVTPLSNKKNLNEILHYV